MKWNILLVSLTFISILFTPSCSEDKRSDEILIVLSMDGFRYNYTDRVYTPNFDSIAEVGVKAVSLIPSFPTLTFPNHYTLATGLTPDHHGIVHNTFYDKSIKRKYSIGDTSAVRDPEFYSGEPIWATTENQNKKAAILFWVGSEAPYQQKQPTYWYNYDHDLQYSSRIDSVFAWLDLPKQDRPDLIMWYLDEPDHTGHVYGPDSEVMDSLIIELDAFLGGFLKRLRLHPLAEKINFIVLSDHGMQSLDPTYQVEYLDEYLNPDWVEGVYGYNPNYNIDCKEGFIDSCYSQLKKGTHFRVFKKEEIPESFSYGSNPRTHDLVVLSDSAWTLSYKENNYSPLGAHGYDNRNKNMHAIFYAFGPSFEEGYIQNSFLNTDVYSIMAKVLDINPSPTDGNLEQVKEMFRKN